MRIEKFRIQNYKSILDSGEVTLDPEVTTLLGKNESGKTNVLEALKSFEDDHEYKKEELCLHSDVLDLVDSTSEEEQDIVILTIWFNIEKEDKPKLGDMHPQIAKMKTLKCTKLFDNTCSLDSPEVPLDEFEIDVTKEIDVSLSKIQERASLLAKEFDVHSKRYPAFAGSRPQYNGIIDEIAAFDLDASPDVETVFDDIHSRLRSLPNTDEQIQAEIEAYIGDVLPFKNDIAELLDEGETNLRSLLSQLLPNFVYFTSPEMLEDAVSIDEFLANRGKHKTLSNLLKLCDLDVERIRAAGEWEVLTKLRLASTKITGLVNESWKQADVELRIGIVNDKIVVSVFDDVIGKEHPPSIRSQGFRWYLSFYIDFTAGARGELRNTIILLDDPGVYLHPSGQKDLLNTLEELSESNQIVFSTHSPFMVDRNKLDRVRIVSRTEEKGTLIEEKYYKSNFDALQPIRAAIGMTIGDSLLFHEKNLLVEGISDEIILRAMSEVCRRKDKDHIDTSGISILPVLGADKMSYYATIFAKENLRFVALLDFDPQGKRALKDLTKRFNIDDKGILSLDELTGKGGFLEIEDLIDIDFYMKGVNLAYANVFPKKLQRERITKNDLSEASFRGIKKFFRQKRIQRNKRVDKIKVAKKIQELVATDETPSSQTISTFSKLFKTINERLAVAPES